MTLTDDEIRARFSAFHDAELADRKKSAFIRSRLDESAELRREYDGFLPRCSKALPGWVLRGGPEDVRRAPQPNPVDLLPAVQRGLHARSRGKFYRTRVSRMAGVVPFEAIAVVVLVVLLAIAYASMTLISGVRPCRSTHGAPRGRTTHRTQ